MLAYVKPLVAAGVAGALDHLVLGQRDIKQSAMFGGAVGVAILGAGLATDMIPEISFLNMPDYGVDGKTVGSRVLEIGLGAGAAFVLAKYIVKTNDFNGQTIMPKLAVIVAADIAGELVADYMNVRPLSYFS